MSKPDDKPESDSFFSRWSRRKEQVRKGAVPKPDLGLAPSSPATPQNASSPLHSATLDQAVSPHSLPAPQPEKVTAQAAAHAAAPGDAQANAQADVPAPPTLEEARSLTPASDFSRFVARGVAPEVRNAAVKKLFADPHFNVMDGLDIYIDDYSKPSPLSVADMAKMVSAQFLKLVDDPEDKPLAPAPSAGALAVPPKSAQDSSLQANLQETQNPKRAAPMTTLICSCNQTMPLDAKALGLALDEPLTLHTSLCRRDAPAFQRACRSAAELVVACTQEIRLFNELSEQTEGAVPLAERPIRFVNLRESGGWSQEAAKATPKMAALLSAARLPDPEPVPTVGHHSDGRLLIIGPLEQAQAMAALVSDALDVSLLATGGSGMQTRLYPVLSGRLLSLRGWLGAFEMTVEQSNPIDLDLCTRCNACVAACPEGAIGLDYQVDLSRCQSHRACTQACQALGAIHFERAPQRREEKFDLVLDLRAAAAFTQHALPQGYLHLPPGADAQTQVRAITELRSLVGDFERPRFVSYKQKLCAHSRNEKVGCQACVELCSASAITSEPKRQQIVVNPRLCVGCGSCASVCPSGALSYAYPRASELGQRLRSLLGSYRKAGGQDAALLLHSQQGGAQMLNDLGRMAQLDKSVRGLPARVVPQPLWHTASTGIDLWLSAFAWGASQVWLLLTGQEAPQYAQALREQMAVAQALLHGLGYRGEHFKLIEVRDARELTVLDQALGAAPAQSVGQAASFVAQAEKRATLELVLDHLLQDSVGLAGRCQDEAIALPATSVFGGLNVNREACTLCLSCVSACPAGALQDNADRPQLRFVEKNCVQCGLCARTCPENAIALQPRLWLGQERREPRVLHEAPPYQCVRCAKPFGTHKGIELMLAKLSGHAMFQGQALERLKMCGDCRVVDIYTDPNEVRMD